MLRPGNERFYSNGSARGMPRVITGCPLLCTRAYADFVSSSSSSTARSRARLENARTALRNKNLFEIKARQHEREYMYI